LDNRVVCVIAGSRAELAPISLDTDLFDRR
jgi:hypothetical protein